VAVVKIAAGRQGRRGLGLSWSPEAWPLLVARGLPSLGRPRLASGTVGPCIEKTRLQSMPKLRHYDNLGMARCVTFNCWHDYQLLTRADDIRALLRTTGDVCKSHSISIYAYVIMPEHVHLVLRSPEDVPLGRVIGEIKSRSARAVLARWRVENIQSLRVLTRMQGESGVMRFWQHRCYDHNCRSQEATLEKIGYCHNNPVRRKLVQVPEDWPWSSSRWYLGLDRIELEIDGYAP